MQLYVTENGATILGAPRSSTWYLCGGVPLTNVGHHRLGSWVLLSMTSCYKVVEFGFAGCQRWHQGLRWSIFTEPFCVWASMPTSRDGLSGGHSVVSSADICSCTRLPVPTFVRLRQPRWFVRRCALFPFAPTLATVTLTFSSTVPLHHPSTRKNAPRSSTCYFRGGVPSPDVGHYRIWSRLKPSMASSCNVADIWLLGCQRRHPGPWV